MYRILTPGNVQPLGIPDPIAEPLPIKDRALVCTEMAIHRRTAEVFAHLGGKDWAFWVSEDLVNLRWIRLKHNEVILIEPNTWHYGPIPLFDGRGDFMIVCRRGTHDQDTEFKKVDKPGMPPESGR